MLFLFGHQIVNDAINEIPPIAGEHGGDDDLETYSITGYAVLLCLSSFYFLCSALVLRLVKDPDI
eukprot:CAMPEP_0202456784 /NCGR_PEP_ID=MMETSP1360-20130828/13963_1 /ASSEMBLY_ACC=CAM_ASM_000848 /TAXON_ID=515479 /ORGANISM="Licmophora paradoxa, Strain CCMP2313" /LENGTH=64 /DNA_ID=CAMNT_0049076693 /DNA_START=1 /DNA_END=195 /DNA_ORIENTATION=-